ncbi:hypothetical protein [Rhabdothermincola salaria]|uniref:hypothetical protein n=1 Tax=Rhabdothermincola salaria TaxID=2903142 RepID=UPI001E38D164|nr:hypothetical protein [Rhabdothermincola salaria]MCD9622674.1 hypothetical protein [Rhabdothermincola salaria]
MIAVLAVCLALAVIACVWLAARGNRTAQDLTAARASVEQLEEQLGASDAARTAAESDLAAARGELDEAHRDLERLRSELDESRTTAAAADAARIEAEEQLTEAGHDLQTAEQRVSEAEERVSVAEARLVELMLERADAPTLTDVVDGDETPARGEPARSGADEGFDGGPGPDTLWALELARTRRTWHTSVSADPTAETFDDGGDPLRAAIDVDVAALREEAGVDVAVDWELDRVLEGAAALAVLRSTQELLAAATRMADDARLTVRRDATDVVIDVTEPDGTAGRFTELAGALTGRGLSASDSGIRVLGAADATPT